MKDDRQDRLSEAARSSPAVAQALSGLSPQDMEKLRAVLNDPEQTRKILATPMAQQMLLRLTGGEKK